ncbi:MAG: HupE / UreJ protein [Marinobacter excellens HL-55]|uniref:HupE / UreJ protein n=1 Tax=Marinobacter excellens HL-55 TaxID=1305731 RepID=A0A0P7YLX4_9GAMM|nr:MAG: HupE / UreJ protein [Marinobacter excellens HL-55]
MNRHLVTRLLLLAALLAGPSLAWAHKASDAFIYLDLDQSTIRVDIALRDLALEVPLDRNADQQISGAELRAARDAITRYLEKGLTLANHGSSCALRGEQWGLSTHSDGPYAAAFYRFACANGQAPESLTYTLLFDRDPLHRGLVSLTEGGQETLAVIAPDATTLALDATGFGSARLFGTFLYEGIIHLLIGLDHVLFLLVLMLPATIRRRDATQPGNTADPVGLKPRLLELIGIVSAFTVAHSVTLGLSALGVVRPPIAWVETIIALSIALAALNVVWPILGRKTWKLAFGFGLIHGFGFASVLGDLTADVSQLTVALAGFNLGVELGQVALVLVVFPLLYVCARSRLYERAAVPVMLMAVGALSLYWVVERVAEI